MWFVDTTKYGSCNAISACWAHDKKRWSNFFPPGALLAGMSTNVVQQCTPIVLSVVDVIVYWSERLLTRRKSRPLGLSTCAPALANVYVTGSILFVIETWSTSSLFHSPIRTYHNCGPISGGREKNAGLLTHSVAWLWWAILSIFQHDKFADSTTVDDKWVARSNRNYKSILFVSF